MLNNYSEKKSALCLFQLPIILRKNKMFQLLGGLFFKKNDNEERTHVRIMLVGCMLGMAVIHIMSVIQRPPVHLYMLFLGFIPVLLKTFFPSHWLLFHITAVKTMDSYERGINPVTVTSTILGKDIG